jgi:glucose/arabinose dehydrogenase/N-acetylneuraminic acid mutarotase
VVDYDSNGSELTLLDASDSHTHEPGRVLTAWEWRENSNLLSSLEVDALPFALGAHSVELTIYDDNTPPESLAATESFQVVPVSQVPGVLALYYRASPPTTTATSLLDAFPPEADFAEILTSVDVTSVAGGIGSSGFTADVMVRLSARFDVQTPGLYDFLPSGGVAHRIEIDGAPFSAPISLGAGLHDLELRWAVDSLADLPLGLAFTVDGGAAQSLAPAGLFHDQTVNVPVINSMPQAGVAGGGNQIIISGLGFFPQNSVTVHWGSTDLTSASFTSWSADSIAFLSPTGSPGFINVTVETPVGISNTALFEYQSFGPVPISFISGPKTSVIQPTAAEWGPDGRLYVTSRDGTVHAYTFDDAYGIQSVQTYPGVSALSNPEIMGIALNPFDPPSPVKLYVSHSEMYAQGGGSFSGPSPYTGQVSVLTGPNFDTPVPLISNLPTSNHDHGVNGMVFDNNGDLLLSVGSNTNAGVKHPNIGDLPESPFSAAILKAQTSRPDFAGDLMYVESVSGLVNNDQVFGDIVDPIPGRHVSVHSAGIRNSFDMVLTTWGRLYATDNGPNKSFGVASLSATTQTAVHPEDEDELLLVEYDHYYGHPNRNRGRTRPIENVYLDTLAPPQAGFTQTLTTFPSSDNGIVEYRSAGFGGQLRGDLMVQKYNGVVRRVQLSADKLSVTSVTSLDPSLVSKGLNLRAGPGGALITIDYNGDKLRVSLPNDTSINGPTVLDITPWRAANTGATPFVIGGENFGTLADTTVSIDGQPATLTSVDSKRIVGTFPLHPSPPSGLVTVTVTVAGTPLNLDQAVQFLPATPGLWLGRWESATDMPMAVGEVACGVIDGVVYLVGEGSSNTLAWDRLTDTWSSNRAVRPLQGHHHAAEVHQGKWFLIGGLGGPSKGKVQIYDPVLDQWTLGASMPWNGGSVSTALIDGKIYAAGGIVGTTTVDQCAVYDIAQDAWTSLTPMPNQQGRNHAASGTDGSRFFILGGRGIGSGAGNTVANGFPDVQIYDPVADTWTTSLDPGSTLNPMPIGRGGTGKAVFYKGEFHVFGGETLNGPGAQPGNVYDRVDVYDPLANTWRLEAPMPTPRHGIFPVLWQGKILLPGGGVVAGFSSSDKSEIYDRQ